LLEIKIEKSFKKDIARDKKSGIYSVENFNMLKTLISNLQALNTIDIKYKRHPLKGAMSSLESLHVKGDWLLVFSIDEKYLNLMMFGKHTQVYKKFK